MPKLSKTSVPSKGAVTGHVQTLRGFGVVLKQQALGTHTKLARRCSVWSPQCHKGPEQLPMQTPILVSFSFRAKGKGGQSQSWTTYKGLCTYQGMSSSTLLIARGQKKTMLEFLFHCLSPAHESLASNKPFLIVIESHALSSASPALPSTNE